MSAVRIINEIKRRNHALLSEDGIRRINNLLDMMIDKSA